MNLLTDKLRDSFFIDGKRFYINTDFKCWIKISNYLKQKDKEGIIKALCLCYKTMPENLEKAVSNMLLFLRCESTKKSKNNHYEKVYDFYDDSDLIFSSFLKAYHINLLNEKMHWYVFCNLLFSLPEDTAFSKAVFYRGVNLADIKSKEQRNFYKKMKNIYALKTTESEIDVAFEIGGAFIT